MARTPPSDESRRSSRDAILGAAFELFAHRGYDATTIDAIARQAGLSKGATYTYFRSKEALLEAIIAERIEEVIGRLQEIDPGLPAPERLARLLHETVESLRLEPEVFRLYLSISLQPSGNRAVAQAIDRLADRIAVLDAYERALFRELGAPDPELEAVLFRTAVRGMVLEYVTAPSVYPLERVRDYLLARFGKSWAER